MRCCCFDRGLAAIGRFNLRLVLSGKQTSHWPRLRRRIQGLGLSDIVVHEGYVTRQRVAQLYRGAEAVLLPTQFEGFGLPVLEAATFGKRVITSRLAVFDEVGVPAENQIDFTQPDQLLQALGLPAPTILTRSPWTWDDCARATLDVLRTTGRIASRRPETP